MGSRLLVGNLEFRFSLLRPFGASQGMYEPVPVEVAFFADGGLAWNSLQQPTTAAIILGSSQLPHSCSAHDGPGRGWGFQFNLAPGY